MKPIRILQVVGSLNNGGSQAMIMNLYENIDKSLIQFDFIINYPNENFYADRIKELGGEVYVLPNFSFSNSLNFVKEWKKFLKHHPEYRIIHGHVRSTAAIYLRIAKEYGLITISHSHSISNGKGFSAQIKNILQFPIRFEAEYLLACSKEAGAWLYGKKTLEKDNFYIIKNAIDTQKFSFNQSKRLAIRKEYNLENNFVVGNVGRFTKPKNHTFLIDIFYEIYKKSDNVILMLVGDGELMNDIKKKVQKLGIVDRVIFTGIRSDISDLLQAMDVFLFPSLYEGLGMVTIEAQAADLACVVSDRVPNETNLTNRIEYNSLDYSPTKWAENVLKLKNNYIRSDNKGVIIKAGYDIEDTSKWIQSFYLKLNEDYYQRKELR